MNKALNFILSILMLSILGALIYMGQQRENKKWEDGKNEIISGRIFRMYKQDKTEKNWRIIFRDGREYRPPFFVDDKKVDIGDSLYKGPGGYKFIIYKEFNPSDSIVIEVR